MLENFAIETFQPHVGGDFSVAIDAADSISLRLTAATALPNRNPSAPRQPFSLLFRGPHERPLPQGMFLFSHPALGAFDLFIVPVGRDEAGYLYEAVFN